MATYVHMETGKKYQEVGMSTLLILCAGVGTAYLASRATRHDTFQLSNLLIGVIGGLVGLSIGQYFGMAEASWNLGLPLLVACGLTLGLSSTKTLHA
jgi:uncharacterized membrane protein YeaQ/YmgE (transglycosylase-associated protein family)